MSNKTRMKYKASVYDITSGRLPFKDESYKGSMKILGPDDYLLRMAVMREKHHIYVKNSERRKKKRAKTIKTTTKSTTKKTAQQEQEDDENISSGSDSDSEPEVLADSRLDDSIEQRVLPNGVPVYEHEDLPDSDLLKALHAFAAEYYRYHGKYRAFGNFDPTALLGLGILTEELVAETLGDDGHLMYVE